MFRRSPFKDAEVNPEPPQFDMQDRIGLVFAFLWFYRRVFIAAVLIGGIAIWTTWSNPKRGKRAKHEMISKLDEDELPQAKLTFAAKPETSANVESDSGGAELPNAVSPKKTVDELIAECLDLRDKVGGTNAVSNFMICSKLATSARELMSRELTNKQRAFSTAIYIESVSMLDSLNVQGELGIVGPREALLEVGEKYSDDNDPNVRGKANLGMLLAPGYDFLVNGELESLQKFKLEFDRRFENVVNDKKGSSRVIATALFAFGKPEFKSETWPICLGMLDRFEKDGLPEYEQLYTGFREQLYFGDLDLKTLPERIETKDDDADGDTKKFLDGLAVNPDTRFAIFEVAINAIKEYKKAGNREMVETLSKRLKEICGSTQDTEQRNRLLAAIEQATQDDQ